MTDSNDLARQIDPAVIARFGPRLLEAMTRKDFLCFVGRVFNTLNPGSSLQPNWHHEALAYRLEGVRQGKIRRLIVCAPPRNLKSIIISIAFVAWLLGHNPRLKIICVTYSNEIAAKMANDFRLVVSSPWFRQTFPEAVVSARKNTEVETAFTAGGFRLGVSLGGALTGRGGDIIIADDLIKGQDALSEARRETVNQSLRTTLMSRLDNKRDGAIIVTMQRMHDQDYVGTLLRSDSEWDLLKLSAIAEQDERYQIGENEFYDRVAGEALHATREPVEVLKRIEQEIGPDTFSAQYQQNPAPPEGTIIKQEWIRDYDELPQGGYYFISWDTAGKDGPRNAFSVASIWYRKGQLNYLVDLIRGRFSYPTLCATAVELVKKYKPRIVLIEDASTGVALQADIRREVSANIMLVPVVGDKVGRRYLQQGKFASGNVLFPKDKPFMPELLNELLRFPQSKYSDQVDSISQALAYEGSTYTLDYVR